MRFHPFSMQNRRLFRGRAAVNRVRDVGGA
jgi:hypothetical protein